MENTPTTAELKKSPEELRSELHATIDMIQAPDGLGALLRLARYCVPPEATQKRAER